MFFLANTLLNSDSYTMQWASLENLVNKLQIFFKAFNNTIHPRS